MASTNPVRRTPVTPRGTINLRVEGETRRLIDDAAASLGKTRTEFMIDIARREAIDVLLDRRVFLLGTEAFDSFAATLEGSPPPDEKLRALMGRKPVWRE